MRIGIIAAGDLAGKVLLDCINPLRAALSVSDRRTTVALPVGRATTARASG